MASPSIEQLRNFQKSLNSSIDSYISNVDAKSSESTKAKDAALEAIYGSAKGLTDITTNPFSGPILTAFQPMLNAAIRIAIDLDLFNAINERTSLDELAEKSGAEKRLLFRILRALVAANILTEPTEKVYSGTVASKAFTLPNIRDWMKTSFDTLLPIWVQTPAFLAEKGYKDVDDLSNNPTMRLYDGLNFFDGLSKNPTKEADFASAMRIQEHMPPQTLPNYPFDEGAAGFSNEKDAAFMVDVGGGRGQFLSRLHGIFPSLPGHNVLQDLPSVVADVDQEAQRTNNFVAMPHNFFEPQPILGARFYFLRGIIHDWPDQSCLQILGQIRPAMKPGYSKLIVQGFILPEVGCSLMEALNDINMWTCCGRERTLSEYRDLFAQAGFKLLRHFSAEAGSFGIVEAELDPDYVAK